MFWKSILREVGIVRCPLRQSQSSLFHLKGTRRYAVLKIASKSEEEEEEEASLKI